MMDWLIIFDSTQTVLQAEQVLIRQKIPIETVPHSAYDASRCGLAILVSEQFLEKVRTALQDAEIKAEYQLVSERNPP